MAEIVVVFDKERKAQQGIIRQILQEHDVRFQHCDTVNLTGGVVVALGTTALHRVCGVRASIKDAGRVVDKGSSQIILQHTPDSIAEAETAKGGEHERRIAEWWQIWDQVDEILRGAEVPPPEVACLTEPSEILAFLSLLEDYEDLIAYDYETWGDVNPVRPELNTEYRVLSVGVATRDHGGNAFCLDRHIPVYDREIIAQAWRSIMISDRPRVAHNSKFEHKVNFKRFNDTSPKLYCTMLMDAARDEAAAHTLERVMQRCGLGWWRFKQHHESDRIAPMDADLYDLLRYNALDALATLEVYDHLISDVIEVAYPLNLDMGVARSLARLEMKGLHVDVDRAARIRGELKEESYILLDEIQRDPKVKKAGELIWDKVKSFDGTFNPNSPTQMRILVQDVLKAKVKARTKTGIKLDKGVLDILSERYPVLDLIRRYRSVKAMITGFIDKWENFEGPTGAIHSQYNQGRVVTGRLSSTDPNLQNIPKDSVVREVFVSRFNGWLVNADFVQQEPRIMAGWSQDERLVNAINDGLDLHRYVAGEIFNTPYDDVTDKQRSVGKRMNLGILYGQTAHGLSEKTGMTEKEAQKLLDEYDQRFHGVTEWRIGFHKQAIREGYVADLLGSRRHLPGARSPDPRLRDRALRQAGNFPVQSTANYFNLISLTVCQEALGLFADVVGTVHDSLIVDCTDNRLDEVVQIVTAAMEVHNKQWYWDDSPVPMKADVSIGRNLREMSPI